MGLDASYYETEYFKIQTVIDKLYSGAIQSYTLGNVNVTLLNIEMLYKERNRIKNLWQSVTDDENEGLQVGYVI